MSFKPPTQFTFQNPEEWKGWITRYLHFHRAAKLYKEEKDVQISSLLYSMGPEADDIYKTFTNTDRATFQEILQKFESYFQPKKNVIHMRAKFNSRSQLPDENIEQFIRALYDLSEHAEFADRDAAIRDRIILGVQDQELSERLQIDNVLELAEVIKRARHFEQVKCQMKEQRETPQQKIDRISSSSSANQPPRPDFRQQHLQNRRQQDHRHDQRQDFRSSPRQDQDSSRCCIYCGRRPHARGQQCPARGQTCRSCGKRNHFASVCMQRSRHAQNADIVDFHNPNINDDMHEYFFNFDTISQAQLNHNEPPWRVALEVGGSKLTFKIDTGADVCVISKKQFQNLKFPPILMPSKATLRSAGGLIKNMGEFKCIAKCGNVEFDMHAFVVDSETENLLSRSVASSLNLIQKNVDNVHPTMTPSPTDKKLTSTPKPVDMSYPVNCPPVKISLRDDASPYSLPTARRVPVPLLSKVKSELENMEQSGIIERITEATDWCAPMVPVMKKTGAVRICTDFKRLNQSIKRERYMLPTLDDILHKLNGSKVFSKLDAASGYHQIPLDDHSAKLTTFITPHGRFFYRRLPFGISSAPEIFQRVMESILEQEENVICYFDDILIHSSTPQDHEKHLGSV